MPFDEGTGGRLTPRQRRARRRAGVRTSPAPVRGENAADKARTGSVTRAGYTTQAHEFGGATGSFVPSTLAKPPPRRIQSPDATDLNAASARDKFRIIATALEQREGNEAWINRREVNRRRAADLAPVDLNERVRLLNRSSPAETAARESVMPGRRAPTYGRGKPGRSAGDVAGDVGRVAGQFAKGLGEAAVSGAFSSAYDANKPRAGFLSNADRISGGPTGKAIGAGAKAYVEQIALGPDASAFVMGGGRHVGKIGAAFDAAMAGLTFAGGGGGAAAAFGGFGRGTGRVGRDLLGGEKAIEAGKAAKAARRGKAPKVFEVDVPDEFVNAYAPETPGRIAMVYNRKTGKMIIQKQGTGDGVWHSGLIEAWEAQNPSQGPFYKGDDSKEIISIKYYPEGTFHEGQPANIEIGADVPEIPPMLVRNLRKRYPDAAILGWDHDFGYVPLPHLKGAAQERYARYMEEPVTDPRAEPGGEFFNPATPAGRDPTRFMPTEDRAPSDPDAPGVLRGPDPDVMPATLPPSPSKTYDAQGFEVAGPPPERTANDRYGSRWGLPREPGAPITTPRHLWDLMDDVVNKRVTPSTFRRQMDSSQLPEEDEIAAAQEWVDNFMDDLKSRIETGDMSPEGIREALDNPFMPENVRNQIHEYWSEHYYSRPSQIAGTNKEIMDMIDKGQLTREDLQNWLRTVSPSRREALDDYFTQYVERTEGVDYDGRTTRFDSLEDALDHLDSRQRGEGPSEAPGRGIDQDAIDDYGDPMAEAEGLRNNMLDAFEMEIHGGMSRSQLEGHMEEEGLNDKWKDYLRDYHARFESEVKKAREKGEGRPDWPLHTERHPTESTTDSDYIAEHGLPLGPREGDGLQQTFGPNDKFPIEEIELGVRSYNILKRMGVKTIGDFLALTPEQLKNTGHGNFGDKSMREVIDARQEWGKPFTDDEMNELGFMRRRPSDEGVPKGVHDLLDRIAKGEFPYYSELGRAMSEANIPPDWKDYLALKFRDQFETRVNRPPRGEQPFPEDADFQMLDELAGQIRSGQRPLMLEGIIGGIESGTLNKQVFDEWLTQIAMTPSEKKQITDLFHDAEQWVQGRDNHFNAAAVDDLETMVNPPSVGETSGKNYIGVDQFGQPVNVGDEIRYLGKLWKATPEGIEITGAQGNPIDSMSWENVGTSNVSVVRRGGGLTSDDFKEIRAKGEADADELGRKERAATEAKYGKYGEQRPERPQHPGRAATKEEAQQFLDWVAHHRQTTEGRKILRDEKINLGTMGYYQKIARGDISSRGGPRLTGGMPMGPMGSETYALNEYEKELVKKAKAGDSKAMRELEDRRLDHHVRPSRFREWPSDETLRKFAEDDPDIVISKEEIDATRKQLDEGEGNYYDRGESGDEEVPWHELTPSERAARQKATYDRSMAFLDDPEFQKMVEEADPGGGPVKPPSDEKPPTAAGGAGGDEPPDLPPVTFQGWDDEFPQYIDWTETMTEDMTPDEVRAAIRKNKFLEFVNIPRTAKSTLDWSHPFRQSIVTMGAFPREWQESWGPMIEAARDPVAAEAMEAEMRSRPSYEQAKGAGVRFNDLDVDITNREESLAGYRYLHRIWGVKGSARAYTTFGNVSSLAMWETMIKMAKKRELNTAGYTKESKHLLDSMARFVNVANGRGNLKGYGNTLAGINSLFFSPRLIHSRVQLLNPFFYKSLHPMVRKRALLGGSALAGEIAVVSAMAWQAGQMLGVKVQTEIDPRSSDFGKIRIGDTRIDLAGGIGGYMTLYSRLVPTGHEGFKPQFKTKTQHDQVQTTGAGLGKRSPWEIATDFVENKVSPIPASVIDAWKQERGVGQPYDPKMVPVDLLAPINWANVVEQRHNIPAAAATAVLGYVGMGVDTYKTTGHGSMNAKQRMGAAVKKEVAKEKPLARTYGYKEVPPKIVQAITLKAAIDARVKALTKNQRGAKNARKDFEDGGQFKLTGKQRGAAVLTALRDNVPGFNYEAAAATIQNYNDQAVQNYTDSLRELYYGQTLKDWHGKP